MVGEIVSTCRSSCEPNPRLAEVIARIKQIDYTKFCEKVIWHYVN